MANYQVRGIPDGPENDQYKALRLKAAGKGISINKAILEAIRKYVETKSTDR